MMINGTWGFKSYDANFKSAQTLLRNLIDIASKGGNYLLNVGPDASHAPLKVAQAGAKLTIALPGTAPDPIASVVCVGLAAE